MHGLPGKFGSVYPLFGIKRWWNTLAFISVVWDIAMEESRPVVTGKGNQYAVRRVIVIMNSSFKYFVSTSHLKKVN